MTLGKCRGEQQQMWVPSAIERPSGEARLARLREVRAAVTTVAGSEPAYFFQAATGKVTRRRRALCTPMGTSAAGMRVPSDSRTRLPSKTTGELSNGRSEFVPFAKVRFQVKPKPLGRCGTGRTSFVSTSLLAASR